VLSRGRAAAGIPRDDTTLPRDLTRSGQSGGRRIANYAAPPCSVGAGRRGSVWRRESDIPRKMKAVTACQGI